MKISNLINPLLLFVIILNVNIASAQQDSPPVTQLKELYAIDKNFRKTIRSAFENLHDLPDGSSNPWRGKTMTDLYNFLNDWFYFLPNAHNGLDKIIEFSMLYYRNPEGLKFVLEEPGLSWTKYFVEERGKYMDSYASARKVEEWLSNESINNDEYVLPIGGFKSFNDFFTRELKPGARPVEAVTDNSVLVSPADGIINMINNDLRSDSQIPIKGRKTLNLTKLLDNSEYANRFIGGTVLAVFLLPHNYHHYHSPVTGTLIESKDLVGNHLFGMSDIPDLINNGNPGYNKDLSVLENFRHGYFIIKTQEFGYVGVVPVGLQTIGSVVFEEKFKNIKNGKEKKIYKGEKLGHFAYGGSTVLLLFEKNRFNAIGVQQGQKIGRLNKLKSIQLSIDQ
ncbi:phosphatidylserine decarboxylase [Fulvivirgaceae bacterium BMA10]|uniref:Phosphatidylserine decarboxylase n=1 Tax=Splendidivirga corallicola TaxID=3051826 RepID=A0ABT8KRL2_9BACT|nr:phosphatidylserine decarboxylase [Fulvivirgaceae bacterium BMA10]